MTNRILFLSDLEKDFFEKQRKEIDVVCVGDSITGWNNIRSEGIEVPYGPYPTYPEFLQELLGNSLRVADGGIAGEISVNGIDHVEQCLDLFPNSRYFILGFGTNDLPGSSNLERTSKAVIYNMDRMINEIVNKNKVFFLINVPYIAGRRFSKKLLDMAKEERDYHNARLEAYAQEQNIPLADICSLLKEEHFADGVHPNKKGAKVIAQEVYKLIDLKVSRHYPTSG